MLRIFSNVCWLSVCLPGKMSIQVLCSFLTGLSGFSNSHLCIWELDRKEGWVSKKLYFQIVVLEKTLDNPLDCKKIKPVNLKGNQPRIFMGRTDAEAETPILWTPVAKSRLIGKDTDAENDWRQKKKQVAEMRWLDSFTDSMDMDLSKLRKIVENREAWHAAVLQRVGHNSVTEQQQHALLKLSCMSTLYIFYIKSLWSASFSNILFSRQPFYFVDSFLCCAKLFSLM